MSAKAASDPSLGNARRVIRCNRPASVAHAAEAVAQPTKLRREDQYEALLHKAGRLDQAGPTIRVGREPRRKFMSDRSQSISTRRKFLKGAAVASAAAVAAPSVVKAQGPISMRWQSTWPSKDIFHEYAQRLRQEGQRYDRRRSQDRGAARGRRRAGVPAARRGLQGRARRRPRRAGLSLRQADCAGAVGLGSGLRHGRQHAAVLAQVRRRQGAAREDLRLDRRQRRVVPLRADADASRSAGSRSRSPRPRTCRAQVPHRRHLH